MIRLLILLGAALLGAAPAHALVAGDGVALSSGTVSTASNSANFLANASSLTCSSSAGKLIVDSTADTLSWCSSGGSTVKHAALGNDSGDAAGVVDGTIVNADINASAAIDVSKTALTEGFALDISGNSIAFDPTEVTGPQLWGDGSGTMTWTFHTGASNPMIDFYEGGVVDITGTIQQNTVPVVTTTGTQTVTNKTLTSPTLNTPQLNLTNSTSPTPTAEGRIEWDNDTHILAIGNGATTSYAAAGNSSGDASGIVDGTIANADVNASAAIDVSKTALVAGAGLGLSTNTLSTASGEQGFIASGALTCGASTNGKVQVHTTPLQYCDNAATPTLQYAAYGDSAGAATGLACTTCVDGTDIATGAVSAAKVLDGSLTSGDMTETFISAYAGTGLTTDTTTSPDSLKVAANGVALGTDTTGEYVATVAGTSNEVSVSGSGSETAAVTVSLPSTIDLGGKTSLEVPNGSAPTTDAFGEIAGDNDAWAASRGAVQWFDGTANTYLVGALASDAPTNGQVPKWNTGGTITWEDDGGGAGGAHEVTASSLGLSCDSSTNDTATLRAALETGGGAAGKTLFLPSGCKVLLGTPGAGDSVADLASDTTIQCEDGTAGFVLARRMCTGGSLNNVACDSDAQCQGGTCSAYDGDAVASFAPTSGSTYTVFGTAANTTRQAIVGCSIWANQTQGDSTAMGGDGIETGYCSGGTNDGDTCFQVCDTGDATWAGVACNASGATDCGGGSGSCQNRSQCATGGGTCISIPYDVSRGASGAGAINPIDFSNATSARVERVAIWDHRKGDFAISSGMGTSSVVANSTTTGITTDTKSATGFGLTSYNADRFVTYGIKANAYARVRGNVTAGWDAGMYLGTEVIATGNTSDGLPGALTNSFLASYDHTGGLSYSGWKGSVGFMAAGATTTIEGNRSTAFICAAGKNGGQHNWWFRDNICEYNHGPKVIANGSGIEIETNRFAWNTRDTIIALGDVRGRCAGGTRSGLLCLRNMGTNATYGCPSSTCAYSSDFKWGASNVQIDHVSILGNFMHSDQTDVDYIGVAPGKRCQSGDDAGKECSSTADCASSAPCEFPYVKDLNFVGNNLYGATTGDTAVDFSAVSAVRSSGTTTPLLNINIAANRIQGFPTGVAFASASGLGAHINIEGTFQNVTVPLLNWRDEYGFVSGIKGLLPTDDQPVGPITLTAGESISRGHLVSASTSADNTVVKTTTANPERALGVALHDASSGNIKILTSGVGPCIADESISNGAALMPSDSTAGRVKTWTAGNVIVGRALDNPGSAGTVFDCIIGGVPPVQASAAVFPKFAYDQFTVAAGYAACSGTPTQLGSITHSATSGRTIRLQATVAHDVTSSVTRVATVSLRRGGSSCGAGSPTTLISAGTEMKSNENIATAIAFTDTGQSGSVTYRLCACADTGSNIEADNGTLMLTEY